MEVAELLQSAPDTRSIPVLFLSSMITPEDVAANGGVIGGRDMASKRMTVSALVERIDSLL